MTTDPNATVLTIADWLAVHAERAGQLSDSGRNDLRVLLADRLQRPTAWISAHPEFSIPFPILARLETDLSEYFAGCPLPYLLGRVEFYGRDFTVSSAVLIPRPETELLIEAALDWLRIHSECRSVWDVGCGSGCIPITLALETPDLAVRAFDISETALAVAAANVDRYGLAGRVSLIRSDLLTQSSGPLPGLVTANLPYIPTADTDVLPVTRYEPRLALDGGPDGLDLITRLLDQLVELQRIRPSVGAYQYCFEIEYRQDKQVFHLAADRFPAANVCVHADLAGQPRLLLIRGEL
jgi:release factor glutamine methyltransferase